MHHVRRPSLESLDVLFGFAEKRSFKAELKSLLAGGDAVSETCGEKGNHPRKLLTSKDGVSHWIIIILAAAAAAAFELNTLPFLHDSLARLQSCHLWQSLVSRVDKN